MALVFLSKTHKVLLHVTMNKSCFTTRSITTSAVEMKAPCFWCREDVSSPGLIKKIKEQDLSYQTHDNVSSTLMQRWINGENSAMTLLTSIISFLKIFLLYLLTNLV